MFRREKQENLHLYADKKRSCLKMKFYEYFRIFEVFFK